MPTITATCVTAMVRAPTRTLEIYALSLVYHSESNHAIAKRIFRLGSMQTARQPAATSFELLHPTDRRKTSTIANGHYRYDIAGLKALSQSKFAQQLQLHLDSPEFPEACQEAYESTFHTDRGLRDVIIQSFRANPSLSLRPDVEMTIRETPGLAFELFRMASGLPVAS